MSTYNLIPYEIGMYFNKIQCFCFEEQILNPGESVDMPVFFFIDPDVDEDPNCFNMEAVALNYTFHRVQSMEELPRPDFIFPITISQHNTTRFFSKHCNHNTLQCIFRDLHSL